MWLHLWENFHSSTYYLCDYLPSCISFSQLRWTSLLMTPAGSVRGGAAFSSAVPYSSSRPSSCLVSPSLCPAWRRREFLRLNRPCCPHLYPWIMRNPSPAMESCRTTCPTATTCPAANSSEVSVPVTHYTHSYTTKFMFYALILRLVCFSWVRLLLSLKN